MSAFTFAPAVPRPAPCFYLFGCRPTRTYALVPLGQVIAKREFHERKPDGPLINGRDNEGKETGWTDVAELDYRNPAMRQTMIAEMKWWLDRMGIDGFRCDVAGGVPMDFWTEARPGSFLRCLDGCCTLGSIRPFPGRRAIQRDQADKADVTYANHS